MQKHMELIPIGSVPSRIHPVKEFTERIKGGVVMRVVIVMLLAGLAVLAVLAMPLSADECGIPYKTQIPGQVKMNVNFGGTITACRVGQIEGQVQVDLGNCDDPDRTFCTWTAQGTPGGDLPQSATIQLKGWHKVVVCTITATGGLPVELLWFDVE